ncbi:hypothetical protein BDN71DRAFT_1451605 [Pleurotus eryngii]|uniref:Uncharacterized protein n=1 Tax=Pleurotus eryngii TaxID=5323 RepID=A0A9P6D5Y6_PLEER|nr:hypothetical protein BDN71DRAFT_1451605 [Pleurotus eryngii]
MWHLYYRTIFLFRTYAVCGRSRNDCSIFYEIESEGHADIEHMGEPRINPLEKDVDVVA